MKIGLVNFSPIVYSIDTPYREPLGGSQSALCYLAEALAKREHSVTIFVNLDKKFVSRGINHIPYHRPENFSQAKLDFLIIQNTPHFGVGLKTVLGQKTKLVFWSQHAIDQPAVQSLHDKQLSDVFDTFVFISQWQMEEYLRAFPIDKKKCLILRNAVSPAFENLFADNEKVLKYKTKNPILAYTSTPFRGLDLMIELFPQIRHRVPNIRLKVFSGMSVYQTPKSEEGRNYGALYQTCRETDGVEYIGSVSQTKLAKALKKVLVLAYPNTFPETSCISAMEAMAAGCQIITSDLGALPETTAGFAKLISMRGGKEQYSKDFIDETIKVLQKFLKGNREQLLGHLSRQITFTNSNYTWEKRAREWEMELKDN